MLTSYNKELRLEDNAAFGGEKAEHPEDSSDDAAVALKSQAWLSHRIPSPGRSWWAA
jgi:hypothetical protein